MYRKWQDKVGRTGERGFTLIELVVVLVLLVAAATVVIPTISRAFANLQLRAAAHSVATLFLQAKSRALQEGRTYQIVVPAEGARVFLVREDGAVVNRVVLPAGISVRQPGEGEEPGPPIGSIRFFPNGMSESVQLELRDARAYRVELRLEPLAGTLEVTGVLRAGP